MEESFGQHVIRSLEEALRDIKAGKPLKQSIVRRMVVKGKVKYVRETYEAPLLPRHKMHPPADEQVSDEG